MVSECILIFFDILVSGFFNILSIFQVDEFCFVHYLTKYALVMRKKGGLSSNYIVWAIKHSLITKNTGLKYLFATK